MKVESLLPEVSKDKIEKKKKKDVNFMAGNICIIDLLYFLLKKVYKHTYTCTHTPHKKHPKITIACIMALKKSSLVAQMVKSLPAMFEP